MNTNISLFGKIAARSFLAWLRVTIPGILLCITAFVFSLILFPVQSPGFAGAGTGLPGVILAILVLLSSAFWPTLLLILSLGGMLLFSSMASGYAVRTALSLCWENKLGDYLIHKLSGYLDRVLPRLALKNNESDAALTKESIKELKAETRQDTGTNKLQKRLLNYLLGKVKLEDINWHAPAPEIKQAILAKLKALITDKLTPSPLWIRFTMILYVVAIILAWRYGR